MLSLIEIDSQSKQESEPIGYELGYYVSDNLPDITVNDIKLTINSITDIEIKDISGNVLRFSHRY